MIKIPCVIVLHTASTYMQQTKIATEDNSYCHDYVTICDCDYKKYILYLTSKIMEDVFNIK